MKLLFATALCAIAAGSTTGNATTTKPEGPGSKIEDNVCPPADLNLPKDCQTYFDGCNTCTCDVGCSEKICKELEEPRCLKKPARDRPCPMTPCAEAEPKMGNDGCPTCIPKLENCTREKVADCKKNMDNLPKCEAGKRPFKTKECCLSCKPELPKRGIRPDAPCKCPKKIVAKLATCAADKAGIFNKDTCCRSCVPEVLKRQKGKKCSSEDFATCKAAKPECEGREKGEVDGTCCPSCTRARAACALKDVIDQCADVEECGDGETPARVLGTCCLSCRPKPHCNTKCGDDEKCSSGGCRKKKTKKLALRVAKALVERVKGDEEEKKIIIKEIIAEVVNRFCDRLVDEARERKCHGVSEKLETLLVKKVKQIMKRRKRRDGKKDTVTDGVDIEVEIETVDSEEPDAADTTAAAVDTTTAATTAAADTTIAAADTTTAAADTTTAAADTTTVYRRRLTADERDVFDAALLDPDATEGKVEELEADEDGNTSDGTTTTSDGNTSDGTTTTSDGNTTTSGSDGNTTTSDDKENTSDDKEDTSSASKAGFAFAAFLVASFW